MLQTLPGRAYDPRLLDALERLDVAQVGSALVEEEGGGGMPQGMRGNDRHARALTGDFKACVEGLVANGRAVPARENERGAREVDCPRPQPHTLHTFQESEPLLERGRQFWGERKVAEGKVSKARPSAAAQAIILSQVRR